MSLLVMVEGSDSPNDGQAGASTPVMDQAMTIQAIEARFGSEWVLVEDPEFDDSQNAIGGRVRFHSKDRDEVDRVDRQLRPASAAYVYTGQVPDDEAVIL